MLSRWLQRLVRPGTGDALQTWTLPAHQAGENRRATDPELNRENECGGRHNLFAANAAARTEIRSTTGEARAQKISAAATPVYSVPAMLSPHRSALVAMNPAEEMTRKPSIPAKTIAVRFMHRCRDGFTAESRTFNAQPRGRTTWNAEKSQLSPLAAATC
jgi:hypothetical protein